MEFLLLGPLEVRDAGREVALPRAKQRALLALLLLHANEVVSTDRILDALWGEAPPKTALDSLHNLVSQLRRALGRELVVTRPPGYLLEVEPWRIDLHRFEQLVGAADGLPPEERAAKLVEALALWRGPPLADLAFESFAAGEVERLDDLRAGAQEELLGIELARGREAEAVPELQRLVAERPLRERPRELLMLALYRAGRQTEALDAFRDARRTLRDELGLEPGVRLRTLQAAILRQDPGLRRPRAPRQAETSAAAQRRTVAVLACELSIAPELDPEALLGLLDRSRSRFRAAVETHGGAFLDVAPGELLAHFGATASREDDTVRAVRAAAEAHLFFVGLAPEVARELGVVLEARIAVEAGTAIVEGDAVVGSVVTATRALARGSAHDAVSVGDGALALLGGSASVDNGGRLRSVEPAGAATRVPGGPVLGRETELAGLLKEIDTARAERGCRVIALLGDAGIGKTRLAEEVRARAGAGTSVLVGRCAAYGEGATYRPLVELVEAAAGGRTRAAIDGVVAGEPDAEPVARGVAGLVGAEQTATSASEAHWAVRRFLEARARDETVVAVLDDLHWAEPALLDLVDYLATWSRGAPLLVLCLARPDVLARRPGWGAAPSRVVRLDLAPLDPDAVAELVQGGPLDEPSAARVVELAEGNPLFAEQLLAFAADGGSLEALPPTISALVAARLDRLAPLERDVLERAAVLGRDFTAETLAALAANRDDAHTLAGLDGRGLLDRAGDAFRFHHALVRGVAYDAIPKQRRAEIHEAVAGVLEREPDASDELVGFHLEQAHRYRVEVAPADGRARRLAGDAGERLGDAGIAAWHRGDVGATVNLLGRATALLERGGPRRRELLCELGIALRTGGALAHAESVLGEAVESSAAAGDRRLELRGAIELAIVRFLAGGEGEDERLLALAAEAVPLFEALGDDRSLGRTWLATGYVEGGFRGHLAAWQAAAERATAHYRRAGWAPSTCIGELAAALFHGPTPVPAALARCEQLLADRDLDRTGRANVLRHRAGLLAQEGRFDEARVASRDVQQTFEELGHVVTAAISGAAMAVHIELLAGDAEATVGPLRAACELLQDRREWVHLASRAALLAESLAAVGSLEDAEHWRALAEEHAAATDIWAQFQWRRAGARVLARRGRRGEAEHLAREALAIVGETDALNEHAATLLALAETLDPSDRAEAVQAACELYERKGNVAAIGLLAVTAAE